MKWEWLKARLQTLGLTQAQFADQIDWETTRVSELINGKRDFPGRKLKKAAHVLDVFFQDLSDYNNDHTTRIPEPIDHEKRTMIERAVAKALQKNKAFLSAGEQEEIVHDLYARTDWTKSSQTKKAS